MLLNIIHLPHRKDRWILLQQELKGQGISDYKVWDGIIDPVLPCRGISQAHKQVINVAKEMSWPEVLIGEDDLHFRAPNAFQYFLDKKPADFDIYLGGIIYGKINDENRVTDFSGTTMYMVSQKFYDIILQLPETEHLDRALGGKGKFIVCHPFVVIPHNGYSDNHKRYMDYTPYLSSPSFNKFI
jgi:hypothetical protein